MKRFSETRSFRLQLNGERVQVEAAISKAAYEIFSVRNAAGTEVPTVPEDLDEIEAQLERIESTTLAAYDSETGRTETVTVVSLGWDVLFVTRQDGTNARRSSPLFTEAAECFAIDREYAEAVESGYARTAAAAGYLRPQTWPNSSGHGLRRAA